MGDGFSQKSRHGLSKTGGKVELKNLKDNDVSKEKVFKPDEFNRLDLNVKELNTEEKNFKPESVHRYVESLVTGKFQNVKPGFNPNAVEEIDVGVDQDGDGMISTQELNDYEMRK